MVVTDHYCLLKCDTLYSGRQVPFQRKTGTSSSIPPTSQKRAVFSLEYLYTLNVTEEGGATRKVAPES